MVDVRRVNLPGVGVLHSFETDDGGKVGVIAHRSGQSDLISFADADDADDSRKVSLRLDEDEAHTLAELLGGTRITESISRMDDIPGLTIDWFPVEAADVIAGKKLGEIVSGSVAGFTVVAVVRGEDATPAPGDDFVVMAGDTLVVAGSPAKVAKASAYLRTGRLPADAAVHAPPGG